MCVLGNTAIVNALEAGNLIITPAPEPEPGHNKSPYDTCSVKLHLDTHLVVPKNDLQVSFDLSVPSKSLSHTLDSLYKRIRLPSSGYVLKPGAFVLAQTKEEVGFPFNKFIQLAGRIEGRSSFARTGLLIHFTAPTLHAGWQGKITLELLNHGPFNMILTPGLAICQLIVETVEGIPTSSAPENSQFHRQWLPTGEPQTTEAT